MTTVTPDRMKDDANTSPRAASSGARLLIVDDDPDMRELLREELEDEGFFIEVASGGRAAVERIRQGGIDLVVSDVRMPDLDGLDLLREIRQVENRPFVITITAFGSIDTAIRAVKLGAFDYITKPFEMRELLVAIERALHERTNRARGGSGLIPLAQVSETAALAEAGSVPAPTAKPSRPTAPAPPLPSRTEHLGELIGRSRAMLDVFDLVRRLEGSLVGVLITGEPGTGKELVARAVHAHSPRAGRAFVAVNCAAIPENLLESELFGVRKGAFTGAHTDRAGLFAEAEGGTLFLDEVVELPVALQLKLARALQENEIRPLGAARAQPIDVRIVAATNRDLEAELRAGRFREDLYYRLNIVELHLPPLRERVDDILPLAEHFLARAARRAGKAVRGLNEEVRKLLLAYAFPGNVRELENVVERAVALSSGPMITIADLPAALRDRRNQNRLADALAQGLTLGELERAYIERVLEAEGGNKTRAALRLGVDRRTLYRKLEEWEAGGGTTPDSRTRSPGGGPV